MSIKLKTSSHQLKTLKLPLIAALSSYFLVACNTAPVTPIAIPQPQTPSQPPIQVTTPTPIVQDRSLDTWNQPAQSVALLDDATLAILENLLEARDMSMVESDQLLIEQYGNLWDRIRQGYRLPQPSYNERIEAQKAWFISRQSYLDRLTARASRYLYHTITEAERRGIPVELALLPIIESSYDPAATSNAAAAGLWQFIPSTGRIYGLNQSQTYDGRRDVIESTRAAYDFLTSLYNQFGSWELALAAYNAGPGRVQRAIDANRARGLSTDYWSLSLPTETMNYVPRFMAVAQIIANPSQYQVNIPKIANHQHFRTVPVNYGVSLNDVALATQVDLAELQLLNPALINLRVESIGPNRVVIPNDLPSSIDDKVKKLSGYDGQNQPTSSVQTVAYIAPITTHNMSSSTSLTQAMQESNTLPTTTAQITPNRTITQEPSLSSEERDYIAEQIRLNAPEVVQPINATDGKIELNAVQTAQSVLDARNEKRKVVFSTNQTPIPTTSKPQATPAKPTSQNSTQTTVKQNDGTHLVVSGETLTSIAKQYKVTVGDLLAWNQMDPDAKLYAGTKLKLSGASVSQSSAQSKPSQAKPSTKSDSYKVKSGDTLTSVANAHNLTVAQLASYNNMSTTTKLLEGQKLWLVADKVTPQAKATPIKTYKVQSGDTLIGLAKQWGVTPDDIAQLNDFSKTDGLIADTTINIPANVNTNTKSTSVSTKSGKYTVRTGDTLTAVAKQHRVSIAELATANNISQRAELRSGQTLVIPVAGASNSSNQEKPADKPATTHSFKHTEDYQVKSGDTLTSLAKQYDVSVLQLAQANQLDSKARLVAGTTIKVPKLTTTHKVKAGESLHSLAKHYKISVAQLAQMNGLKPDDGLKVNQVLTVPLK